MSETARPRGRLSAATIAMAILIATPFIAGHEGKRTVGYRDIVGVPTYCYGGTGKQAVVGKTYTDDACASQLAQGVSDHAKGILPCIRVDVPPPSLAAFVSFSYNVGAAGFCRSGIARALNAGDLKSACAGLSAWVYAGGKKVQGLVNRRRDERALCEKGLTA